MQNSPIADLDNPIAVVCHDAGAANIVVSWIGQDELDFIQPVMQGPAEKIWRNKFPHAALCLGIDHALDGAKTLVSGTGWASDLEHDARQTAEKKEIRSIAVVDHWVNYEMRFVRNATMTLPQEIWVGDEYARELAQVAFPSLTVSQKTNHYLEKQVSEIKSVDESNGDILFILEPARDDWGKAFAGEFQALDYFIENAGVLGVAPNDNIRIRPHPSDAAHKYDEWLAKNVGVSIDLESDLAKSISQSRLVVGMQSFALVVALEAGRKVVSALPMWAPDCKLPHDGIIHLKELVAR